jgi:hypothetical protein
MFLYCDVFGLSAIHYLLLYAILSASCILLYSFFWVIPWPLNFMCRLSEHSASFIVIGGVSRTPYTLCNFTVLSVSVCNQIGTVGGAEHTQTTEQETARPFVFPVTLTVLIG